MSDYSDLKSNDTLQEFYDKHNGRLPTNPIPLEIIEPKEPNKSLKVFYSKLDKNYPVQTE